MDARVKGRARFLLVVGHGGVGAGGLATGVRLSTTVTLRCAGRDRRTVSGRGLPRTRVASRDRIEVSRVLRGGAATVRPAPTALGAQAASGSSRAGWSVISAHRKPASSRAIATLAT